MKPIYLSTLDQKMLSYSSFVKTLVIQYRDTVDGREFHESHLFAVRMMNEFAKLLVVYVDTNG